MSFETNLMNLYKFDNLDLSLFNSVETDQFKNPQNLNKTFSIRIDGKLVTHEWTLSRSLFFKGS